MPHIKVERAYAAHSRYARFFIICVISHTSDEKVDRVAQNPAFRSISAFADIPFAPAYAVKIPSIIDASMFAEKVPHAKPVRAGLNFSDNAARKTAPKAPPNAA